MSDIEWKVLKSNDDAERAQLNKILADIRQQLYSSSSSGGVGTVGNTTVTGSFEDRLNAVANAWRDLSARVYRNGDEVTAIAQDIAYLSARIDDADTGQSGMAEAIDSLITRVTFNEQGIEAVATRTTDLEAAVNDPVSGLSGLGEAVDTLSTRVTTNEDGIVSVGQRTTSLENEVRDTETGLAATASAVDELTNTVGILGDDVFSISNRTTTLENEIHDPETGLQANASAIDNLGSSVQQIGDDVVAVANRTTDLEVTVNDPETGLAATASATEDLRVEVDTLSNTVLAAYTLDLDANGYIVGWKFTNDGSTGVVDFRADRFRISAPGSIKSVEFADGILISDTGTHSYYHGVDFGALNDLITWFGATPTAGPDGATTDNGLFWIKNDGSGYFGGGLSNTVVENLPIVQEIIINIDDLDGEVVAVIQQVNNLETAINDPVSGLSTRASLSQLNEVKSRLDNTGNGLSIESVASTVNSLNTAVNDPSTGLATKASNTRVSTAESRLDNAGGPGKTIESVASDVLTLRADVNNAATKAELTAAQNTLAAADQALAEDIRVLDVAIGDNKNLVTNPSPRTTTDPWTNFAGVSSIQRVLGWNHPIEDRVFRFNFSGGTTTATAYEPPFHLVSPGEVLVLSIDSRTVSFAGGNYYTLGCWFRDASGNQIGTSRQYSIGDLGPSAVWETHEGLVTVPEGAHDVRIAVSASNPPAGSAVLAARISARRQSADGAILSSLVDIARADIQQNEDDIAAAVQRISSAETAIDGKASASDLAATQLTVSQQGNTLSSHGKTLNGLTATVGDHTASITEQREVSAQLLDGSVSINDPGFERQEWGGGTSGTGALPTEVSFTSASANQLSGLTSLRIGGVAGSGQRLIYSSRTIRVQPGQQLRFTLNSRSGSPMTSGDYVRLGGRLYTADSPNGSNQTFFNVQRMSDGSSWGFSNGRASGIFTVPEGIIEIRPYVIAVVTSGAIVVDDLSVELVGEDLASVLARYSLAVTAGGDVAGMQLLAGGGISAFRILASMFQIVDPGGTGGYTHSNGISIWRKGGYMTVMGPGFGAGNEFMKWFGPEQSTLANCRRSNAISFETINGLHYSLGAMFSGTITAGGYTTSLSATRYSTGTFGTNGQPIVVNASFSQSRRQMGGRSGTTKNTISAGSGSTKARIELWRRAGGGSWQLVSSAERDGVLNITNYPDPDIENHADWNNTVSLTYTDSVGGTASREFEVRLITATLQNVNISGGAPVPAPQDSRALGVRTSE